VIGNRSSHTGPGAKAPCVEVVDVDVDEANECVCGTYVPCVEGVSEVEVLWGFLWCWERCGSTSVTCWK
jgi:hypothetical protein